MPKKKLNYKKKKLLTRKNVRNKSLTSSFLCKLPCTGQTLVGKLRNESFRNPRGAVKLKGLTLETSLGKNIILETYLTICPILERLRVGMAI